jgi:hypothetical protein
MAEEEPVLAVKSGMFGVVVGRIGQRRLQGDCAQTDTLASCFCCGAAGISRLCMPSRASSVESAPWFLLTRPVGESLVIATLR